MAYVHASTYLNSFNGTIFGWYQSEGLHMAYIPFWATEYSCTNRFITQPRLLSDIIARCHMRSFTMELAINIYLALRIPLRKITVIPVNGVGRKVNGVWTGVLGELAAGTVHNLPRT